MSRSALFLLVFLSVVACSGDGSETPEDEVVTPEASEGLADQPADDTDSTTNNAHNPTEWPTTTNVTDPQVVASQLAAPWSIAFIGTTALVSERDSGNILELDEHGNARVVGTINDVHHGGEGGLLGLAIEDRNPTAPHLFVYSTARDGNRVQRFELRGSPGSYALGDVVTLIDGMPSGQIHNGGRLAIGPDDMLYVGLGDAGEPAQAQDLSVLAGKIVRMTLDGEVPADNPFRDSYVYSYGHRNVQGLAWDDNGTLYGSELGQNEWDELNVIIAGGNYGWPYAEGIARTEGTENSTESGNNNRESPAGGDSFINPIQQWTPSTASPSGLAYTKGFLIVANLRGSMIRTIPVAAPSTSQEWFDGQFGRVRDVVIHPNGDIWFLTNNTDGRGEPATDDDKIWQFDLE